MASTRTSRTAGETNTDDGVPSGTVEPVIAVNGVEPDTSAPKEAAPASAEETPKMSEMQGIRYTGIADVKKLSMDDLEAMSGEAPKGDLEWSASNSFIVPTKDFNASTRDALLALPDFVAE